MDAIVGYGDGLSSDDTITPPTIECSDLRSELAAAAAIGCAALPNAKIHTRFARSILRASTPRAVAGPGCAAATAASYNSNKNSRPALAGGASTRSLMLRP